MDTLALPAARFLLPHVSSQRFEKIGPILKSQRPQPLLSSVCYLRMESSLRQASINSGVRSVIDSTAAMKLVAASRIPFFSKLSCFFCTPQGLGVGLRARSRSDAVFGSLRKTKGEVYVQHGAKRSFICRAYKNPSSDSQSPLQQERAPTTPLDQLYPSNGATDASSLEESRPLSDKSEDDFADTIGENGKPLHFENAVVEPPPRLRSKRYRNNVLWLLGLRLQLKREIEKVLKSELSRRVVVTMFFLALSRVGQCVLLPGFDRQLLTASRGPRGGDAAGLEELLQSGIPVNLFHIGLFPFIFASVFVEALVELKAVESWSKLKEEGRQGMEKLKEYIWRISGVAAVVFGAGQAVLLRDFSVFSSSSPVKYYFWTTAWLALGAIIYHWIGDRITEDGFGHGTTVLISCSIITASTDSLAAMFRSLANLPPSSACFLVAVWALCFLGMTAGAAVLLGAKRDVELEYFDADFVEGGG